MIVACEWVFGENYLYDNSSHQFEPDAFDNDTMYENMSAFDEMTTERLATKRSTSTIKLESDTEFTYLNIGVLMASHLGEYGAHRHRHKCNGLFELEMKLVHKIKKKKNTRFAIRFGTLWTGR